MFAHGLKRLVNTRFFPGACVRALPSPQSGANSSSLYRFLSVMSPHGFIVFAAAACHENRALSTLILLLCETSVCVVQIKSKCSFLRACSGITHNKKKTGAAASDAEMMSRPFLYKQTPPKQTKRNHLHPFPPLLDLSFTNELFGKTPPHRVPPCPCTQGRGLQAPPFSCEQE